MYSIEDREAAKAGLAACWHVLGGKPDPLASNWANTPEAERAFWMAVAGLKVVGWAARDWNELPHDARNRIRMALRRAAARAALLLGADHES